MASAVPSFYGGYAPQWRDTPQYAMPMGAQYRMPPLPHMYTSEPSNMMPPGYGRGNVFGQPSGFAGAGLPPFSFQRRTGKIDWRTISQLDVDKVIEEIDIDTLQSFVSNITFASIDEEDFRRFSDQHFLKLFRVSQMTIEYLLYVQTYLHDQLQTSEQQARSLGDQHRSVEEQLAKQSEELAAVKRELRQKKKTVSTYEYMLAVANTPAGEGDGNVRLPFGPKGPVFKCTQCKKMFMASHFLEEHYRRRHPDYRREEKEKAPQTQTPIVPIKTESVAATPITPIAPAIDLAAVREVISQEHEKLRLVTEAQVKAVQESLEKKLNEQAATFKNVTTPVVLSSPSPVPVSPTRERVVSIERKPEVDQDAYIQQLRQQEQRNRQLLQQLEEMKEVSRNQMEEQRRQTEAESNRKIEELKRFFESQLRQTKVGPLEDDVQEFRDSDSDTEKKQKKKNKKQKKQDEEAQLREQEELNRVKLELERERARRDEADRVHKEELEKIRRSMLSLMDAQKAEGERTDKERRENSERDASARSRQMEMDEQRLNDEKEQRERERLLEEARYVQEQEEEERRRKMYERDLAKASIEEKLTELQALRPVYSCIPSKMFIKSLFKHDYPKVEGVLDDVLFALKEDMKAFDVEFDTPGLSQEDFESKMDDLLSERHMDPEKQRIVRELEAKIAAWIDKYYDPTKYPSESMMVVPPVSLSSSLQVAAVPAGPLQLDTVKDAVRELMVHGQVGFFAATQRTPAVRMTNKDREEAFGDHQGARQPPSTGPAPAPSRRKLGQSVVGSTVGRLPETDVATASVASAAVGVGSDEEDNKTMQKNIVKELAMQSMSDYLLRINQFAESAIRTDPPESYEDTRTRPVRSADSRPIRPARSILQELDDSDEEDDHRSVGARDNRILSDIGQSDRGQQRGGNVLADIGANERGSQRNVLSEIGSASNSRRGSESRIREEMTSEPVSGFRFQDSLEDDRRVTTAATATSVGTWGSLKERLKQREELPAQETRRNSGILSSLDARDRDRERDRDRDREVDRDRERERERTVLTRGSSFKDYTRQVSSNQPTPSRRPPSGTREEWSNWDDEDDRSPRQTAVEDRRRSYTDNTNTAASSASAVPSYTTDSKPVVLSRGSFGAPSDARRKLSDSSSARGGAARFAELDVEDF